MAHRAMRRACDVSRWQRVPCRPRVPTPGDADGFTGRRSPGDGRCRLAGGRLRAGHRPGPPSAPMPLSPLPSATARRSAMGMSPDGAIGNGKSAAVAAVWIRERRPLTGSAANPPSSGGHRTAQRARHDAEAAAPGASASARRRMTDNHHALHCREGGRPSPASPRNRLAAHEKMLLEFSAASQSSESAPASGHDNAEQALGAGVAEGLRFTRGNERRVPTSTVKIERKPASGCAGGGRECRTSGSAHGNPGMRDADRQQAAAS